MLLTYALAYCYRYRMKLLEYIKQHGKEQASEVARAAGTNYAYLSQIANGHRNCSPSLALKIENATEKLVTRQELRPDVYPQESAA